MFKIAICDDDKYICSEIESILLTYARQHCLQIHTDVFFDGSSLIHYIKQGNDYDLIYLDIEMAQMNGIDVSVQLRKMLRNHSTEIVYISGKDGYDRQLFDFQPLHFIPKPISAPTVIEDMLLAMERKEEKERVFEYKKGKEIFRIPIHKIIYFEVHNREIHIIMTDCTDCFYASMQSICQQMINYKFIQIHRSYLVNYDHIKTLRYTEVVMSNDAILPISKHKRQDLRNLQLEESRNTL